MTRAIFLRLSLLLLLWLPLLGFCIYHATQLRGSAAFSFLVGSNGRVSNLQRENFEESQAGVLPNDQIVMLNGRPFETSWAKRFLKEHEPRTALNIQVIRQGKNVTVPTLLTKFSKHSYLILFYIPLLLALLFLGFSIFILFQRGAMKRAREAVEVFSAICFGISIFFLLLLPSTTLGIPFSFSILLPLFGVSLVHLFWVYPKKKGARWMRHSLLGTGYFLALALGLSRAFFWNRHEVGWVHNFNAWILGGCFVISLASLGNTLLTSRDFWARRRARLLSLLYVISFLASLSAFVAIVWEAPRISIERLLAVSFTFPTGFAVVFLKSNVFDLERLFRRSLHQFVLLGMAATFALLVGLSWSQWKIAPEADWMLWIAISIVVLAVARPAGNWIEDFLHHQFKTRVRYPRIHDIFERSKGIEDFLLFFFSECESNLNMKTICLACFQDPTKPWSSQNEEIWEYRGGRLFRLLSKPEARLFESILVRGERSIGKIEFNGGDALAFDPKNSPEWSELIRQLTWCIELLTLQEFMAQQQGFLAVGRMQALMAHELKNPLAIIKVCAGLLQPHIPENDEAEELLKTIQSEVVRISSAVQGIFDQSNSSSAAREKVLLPELLKKVSEIARGRFQKGVLEISFWSRGQPAAEKDLESFYLEVESEALKQALTNLVINAFEAGSSWVGIEVHGLHDRSFQILVRDQGQGIPRNVDIFRPFVTTKPNGTGLGLAQVKSFVDRNDAHIRVESTEGKGTVFSLEFAPAPMV